MMALLPNDSVLRRMTRLRLESRAAPSTPGLGSRRGPWPGSSRQFIGLRQYEIGDDVRSVDWAATLRFRRPYVRLYRQETEASLLLLIDTSASMAFDSPSKLAYAQALACALGYLALHRHDRAGVLPFADGPGPGLPIRRGVGQWPALRAVIGGLTAGGRVGFERIPEAVLALGGHRGAVVVLSDFYPPEAFADGLRRLARMAPTVVALRLVSPRERTPDLEGVRDLIDLETQEVRAGFIGPTERARYETRLAELGERLATLCRASGIRDAEIVTDTPVIRCLEGTLLRVGVLRRDGA
jgi:uncharacterized protein (DUF58 family)